jgi:DNA-binding LytR/AlgR family response regulator
MIRIAIVEDTKEDASRFKEYLDQYQVESKEVFELKFFKSAIAFLDEYKCDFNIVFMDIDLPGMTGIDASKKLREKDPNVVLVFLTYLGKYAIKGYSVNAFDFLVKPITYYSFSTMLARAITKCNYEKGNEVTIATEGTIIKLDIFSILYVEVYSHQLTYHTDKGDFSKWGTLSSVEEELTKFGFAKGSPSYLINLRRISVINGNEVILDNGKNLFLSRGQKKDFAEKFTAFISGDGA